MTPQTVTVAEAAKLTGKARSTITRAIAQGKLPNTQRKDDDSFLVSIADLIEAHMLDRVSATNANEHVEAITALEHEKEKLTSELVQLRKDNERLTAQIDDCKRWIEDLRQLRSLTSANTEALETLTSTLRQGQLAPPDTPHDDAPADEGKQSNEQEEKKKESFLKRALKWRL